MSEEELRKKIEILERENARLKDSKRPATYAVREQTYKGHPVFVFEGPSLIKPVTLGIGKFEGYQRHRSADTRVSESAWLPTNRDTKPACPCGGRPDLN